MTRRKRLALVLELAAWWLLILIAVAYLLVASAEPETPTQLHVVETR